MNYRKVGLYWLVYFIFLYSYFDSDKVIFRKGFHEIEGYDAINFLIGIGVVITILTYREFKTK